MENKTDKLLESVKSRDVLTALMQNSFLIAQDIQTNYLPETLRLSEEFKQILSENEHIKIDSVLNKDDIEDERTVAILTSLINKRIAAIDGGLGSGVMGTSMPFIMRAFVYSVKIGDKSDEREQYDGKHFLINRLTSGIIGTKQDLLGAVLLLFELNSAYESLKNNDYNIFLIHGPLIRSLSQYIEYQLSKKDIKEVIGEENYKDFIEWCETNQKTHEVIKEEQFIAAIIFTMNRLLNLAWKKKTLLIGVVERTSSTELIQRIIVSNFKKIYSQNESWFYSVTKRKIDDSASKLSKGKYVKIFLDNLGYTDALFFGQVLSNGNFFSPQQSRANKAQVDNHAIGLDIGFIGKYQELAGLVPDSRFTYIRCNDFNSPFKIEFPAYFSPEDEKLIIDSIFAFSQFLPKYSFPVNLDVVDKMAKVSNWLTKAFMTGIKQEVISHVVSTGITPEGYSQLQLMLKEGGQDRDWYKRP
jgi:hypothetical protein